MILSGYGRPNVGVVVNNVIVVLKSIGSINGSTWFSVRAGVCELMAFFCSLRAYSQQLCEYREQCGAMVEEVRKALEFLQEMHHRHQLVSTKTNSLHQACQQLVREQVRCGYRKVPRVVFHIKGMWW